VVRAAGLRKLSQGKEQSMNWQRLKRTLAQFGAVLLLVFYVAVIAADFVAYDPYDSQPNNQTTTIKLDFVTLSTTQGKQKQDVN